MLRQTDLSDIAQKAIQSNFAMRNARVFSNPSRQERIRATRRRQIREWVCGLRVVRDSATETYVARRLKDTGRLTAHSLRGLIIVAGLDYRIAQAKGEN